MRSLIFFSVVTSYLFLSFALSFSSDFEEELFNAYMKCYGLLLEVDDGVTNPESIAKLLPEKCNKDIEALKEKYKTLENEKACSLADKFLETISSDEEKQRAIDMILDHRKWTKKVDETLGVIERSVAGSWEYIVESIGELSNKVSYKSSPDFKDQFSITCGSAINYSGSPILFLSCDYPIKNEYEYASTIKYPEVSFFGEVERKVIKVPLRVYFGEGTMGAFTRIFFWKSAEDPNSNTVHLEKDDLHILLAKMQRKKIKKMTILVNPSMRPITFNLIGFQECIQKLSKQCKTFYQD